MLAFGAADGERRARPRRSDTGFPAQQRAFLTRPCGEATYDRRSPHRLNGRARIRAESHRSVGAGRSPSATPFPV